jgi:hypothetical protein
MCAIVAKSALVSLLCLATLFLLFNYFSLLVKLFSCIYIIH